MPEDKILETSVRAAHKYLYNAIKKAGKIGKGHSPVNHFWQMKEKD
jgi:hydroxymethylpyrimidine/phosphomethylpyrimidine kinase